MNAAEARKLVVEAMNAVAVPSATGTATVKTIRYNEHGDVTQGTVTRFAERTWGGVPGYTWEVRERGAHGKRTIYLWWLGKAVYQHPQWEAGTLTARTVTGNPDRSAYAVLTETHAVTIEGLALS